MIPSSALSASAKISHSPLSRVNHLNLSKIRTRRLIKACSLDEEPPPSTTYRVSSEFFYVFRKAEVEIKKELKRKREEIELGVGSRLKSLTRRGLLWRRIFFASRKVRSLMILNVLTVIYASDIPVLKEVEAISDPAFFNMVRFSLAAIPFLPVLIKSSGDFKTRSAGLELGLWVSLGYLSQALGMLTSDAGRASFISAFTVIVVPLIDGLIGASIPPLTWFGAIASLFGMAFLESSGSPPCVGDILNLLSALFFGIHMLRTEQVSRKTRKENFLPILSFEVVVVAFSSMIWFAIRESSTNSPQFNFSSFDLLAFWDMFASFPWVPALYTGLFSTVLCLWAEMYAMSDISATETAIVYGLEPVWGAAFAWFLLGERWNSTAWFGAVLILCGSLTVQLLGTGPEETKTLKGNHIQSSKSSQKDQYLSFSTVVVDSRKNVTNTRIKRQDKL
ncbi:Integral membrane protein [Rhynchospora pubera]|uniref:Integral membrane protein n=1 Tax=Rhynchospora pubera TaxID=906938 RepID=A0AAV8FKT7_9POAL|nr:Integral membrane protein [Rhynchospora pubera]